MRASEYPIGWTKFFFGFMWPIIITLISLITFFNFLVQVVWKSLCFHDLASSIFKKFPKVVLVGSSCFDEVILAKIVISGSQFITKFDQIFDHILTDLIFLFLLFCFMVLFQDNPKVVEAHFVWWVLGRRLSEFPLRVVSGILSAMFTGFSFFWSQIRVVILVTPKQEVERKCGWFCGVNYFFALILK